MEGAVLGGARVGTRAPAYKKNRAGSSKRARDPENMVQNCQGAVRAGGCLGAGGLQGHPVGLAARSRQPGAPGQSQPWALGTSLGTGLRLGQDICPWVGGGQDQTQPCDGRAGQW